MNTNEITKEQALQNLYMAARAIQAPADTHDVLLKSYQVLIEVVKPQEKEEDVK